LPLAIVIFINGCKIVFEDQKRKASDEEENNKECLCYNNDRKEFENIKWKNILVGNILKINQNEQFPADLILLNSYDRNCVCYIETKNLDGETNLKIKKSQAEISKYFADETIISEFIGGIVLCSQPDNNIHEFKAHIKLNYHSNNQELTNKTIIIPNNAPKDDKYLRNIFKKYLLNCLFFNLFIFIFI